MDSIRSNAVELVKFWCGGYKGRPTNDPVYIEVTEGRQQHQKSYSSCGDLAHCLAFALGVRSDWVNRVEHDGWHFGEQVGRRWDNNVTTLVCPKWYGVNHQATPSPGRQEIEPGDICVVDCKFPLARVDQNKRRGPTHVCVFLEWGDDGSAITGDYGQPGGAIRRRKLSSGTDGVWFGDRHVDSLLKIDAVVAAAKAEGKLSAAMTPDEWRYAHAVG